MKADGATVEVGDAKRVSIGDGDDLAYRQLIYRSPQLEAVFEIHDGAPVCTRLLLLGGGENPIRTKDLMAVDLDELRHVVYAFAGVFRPNPAGGFVHIFGAGAYRDDLKLIRQTTRHKLTRQRLERIADVYGAAREGQRTDAVVRKFNVGERQALRYIAAARQEGLIKPDDRRLR